MDQPDVDGQPTPALQFSLATLLILVAVAAVAVASITEMPEWLGAPVLAVIVVCSDSPVTIHYVGWESSFDETVPLSRLQIP